MKSETYINKGDFLSLLLEDEVFNTNEELLVDECTTFMFGSTSTSTSLISNVLYYVTVQ